jgi:hypothetical protein
VTCIGAWSDIGATAVFYTHLPRQCLPFVDPSGHPSRRDGLLDRDRGRCTAVDPGDVRAVLVDVDEDALPGWAVTDVHRALDPHGERTMPKLHAPDALTREWLTLGPAERDPRVM